MQMEAKGFLSLPEFLKQKSEKAKQQGSIEVEAEAQAAAAEVVVEGIEEASEASERASTPPPASTEPESVSAAFMVAEMALVLLEVLGVSTAAAKPAMRRRRKSAIQEVRRHQHTHPLTPAVILVTSGSLPGGHLGQSCTTAVRS